MGIGEAQAQARQGYEGLAPEMRTTLRAYETSEEAGQREGQSERMFKLWVNDRPFYVRSIRGCAKSIWEAKTGK